jgi:hypothetical protein
MTAVSDTQLDLFNLRPEWHESFPETRTLPGGWDLSDPPHNGWLPDAGYRMTLASVDDSLAVPLLEGHPASFPELRTLPRNWDLSGLLAFGNG